MTEIPIDHLDIDSVFYNVRVESRKGRPALEIIEDVKKAVELAGSPMISEENLQSFEHFLTVSALLGEANLRTASDFLDKNRNFLISLFKKQKPSDEFIDTLLGFYEGARIVEEILTPEDIKRLTEKYDLNDKPSSRYVTSYLGPFYDRELNEPSDLTFLFDPRVAMQLFSLRNVKFFHLGQFFDFEGIKFYLANKAFFISKIRSNGRNLNDIDPLAVEAPIYSLTLTSDKFAADICQYLQRNPQDELVGFLPILPDSVGEIIFTRPANPNVQNINRRLEYRIGINEYDDQEESFYRQLSDVDLHLMQGRMKTDFTMVSTEEKYKATILTQITENPGHIECLVNLKIRSVEDITLTRRLLMENPRILLEEPIFATIDISAEDLRLFASKTTYFAQEFDDTEDYFWCEFFAGTKCLVLGNTQVSSSTFCTIPEKIRENKQLMDYIFSSERYDGKAYFIEDKALELDDDGVVALADKFSDCVGIVVTNQFVQLSEELLDVLPESLQILDLSHNEISDEGALLLAKYIKKGKFPNLEEVALHHNFISDKALEKLYKSSKNISWDCVDQLD